MSDERRPQLAWSVRAARRSFWVQVSVGTVVALGLGVVVTVVFGVPAVVGGPLVVLLIMGTGSLLGRRSKARSRNDGLTTATETGTDGVRLDNFAFAQGPPTWSGWRRDVGDVTVHPERIDINGLDSDLIVHPPFSASLHDEKYSYWTMVKLIGQTESGEPTTVYLVGMGFPLSKLSADPEDVRCRGNELVIEVNNASASESALEGGQNG